MLVLARYTWQQPASAVQISPNIIEYQTNIIKKTSNELELTSEDSARLKYSYSPKSITRKAFIQVTYNFRNETLFSIYTLKTVVNVI